MGPEGFLVNPEIEQKIEANTKRLLIFIDNLLSIQKIQLTKVSQINGKIFKLLREELGTYEQMCPEFCNGQFWRCRAAVSLK